MRKNYLYILLTMSVGMIGINVSAHDIKVPNTDGVAIYYNRINNNTELAVTYAGDWYGCYNDEYSGDVVIPEEVTFEEGTLKVTRIEESAFCGCAGLTSVSIPNSVTSIEQYAFASCKTLTTISLPNSLTAIGEYAFFSCSALSSITIPSSVTTIGYRAFNNCSALRAIQVESGNAVYDSREDCNAIIETASNTLLFGCQNTIIPNSVTVIGECAFWNCSGLSSITIPNNVTSIGRCAFVNCTGLTSISIPNSVTSIDYCAFADCWNLATVVLPENVTYIGESAFIRCSQLKDMYCYAEQIPELGNNVFENSNYKATLHVPAAFVSAYQAAEQWKDFKEIVALTNQGEETDDSDYIPFVEKGKQWHVVRSDCNSGSPIVHYEKYMLNEEVVKDGKTYLKMYRSEDDLTVLYESGLLREEDRKVYIYDADMQEEHLIFDYSLKVGDTYEAYSSFENKMVSYKVMSIDDCTEGPEEFHYGYDVPTYSFMTRHRHLEKWTVCRTDYESIQKTWIEGVGSLDGPLGNLQDIVLPDLCKDYLAYVDGRWGELYLPFSCYDEINKQIHGSNLPTGAKDDNSSKKPHELTYELEGNRLHVYGKVNTQCGPHNYAYFRERETDDPLTHRVSFWIQEVEPLMDCLALHATDFYVPGFDPNLNYIVVDNNGEEHPVINKTPQMAYRPFVEEGKVWQVGAEGSGNPVQIVEYYYFDGDTIIDGKACKQMMCQRFVSPDSPKYDAYLQQPSLNYVGAWYEEDKKVYEYDSTRKEFTMMYDFSLEDNGTFLTLGQYYVVGPRQTGGMKGFKGIYRDVLMYKDGGSIARSTPWLEGVGGVYGPTVNVFDGELADPMWFLMACAVDDEVIYLNDEYEDGATPENMGAQKRRFDFTHTVKTQPKNPRRREAEQSLYGEYNDKLLGINLDPIDDAYLVRITDETGKVVYEKAIDAGNIVALNVDISSYAIGRYTVTVENSQESFTGEFETQTTGIEEISSKRSEVRDYIYNLQGQRLTSLQKGLNIVNGKKVYVK